MVDQHNSSSSERKAQLSEKLKKQYQTMTVGFVMVSAIVVFLLLVVTENPLAVRLIGKSFFDRPVIEKMIEKVVVATPEPELTPLPTAQPQGIQRYIDSGLSDQFQLLTEAGSKGEYNLAQLVDKETHTNVFDGPLPLQAKWIQSFYFDPDQKALYVIEGTGPYGESYSEFSKITFGNQQYIKKILLVKKSSYKQETNIQKIYSDDKIALTTYSADGCSGSGDISLLENGSERVIMRTGSGAEDPQLPRVIGFSNDLWYVYKVGSNPIDPKGEAACPSYPAVEIFAVGPYAQEPITLLSSTDMPKDVTFIRFSKEDKDIVYLITADDKLYQYHLLTKSLSLSNKDPSTFFDITQQ